MNTPSRRITRIVAACAAVGLVWAAGACGSDDADDTPDDTAVETTEPIAVVASVNQWGSLAEQIGGDDVEVTSIVSSTAVDAHDFEPQTADVAALQEAEIVVSNGAGYDTWATSNLTEDTTSVCAAQIVGAITGDNPHLWFSKDARVGMATELADAFSKARPDLSDQFAERLAEWQESEDEVEELMAAFVEDHPDVTYAATEAVAYYLMSDLGFEDLTPQGYAQSAANESEPAPADLQEFQELVESGGVDVLVDNTQQLSDTATMITESAQTGEVPLFDVSEQMPEDAENLTAWIRSLVETIDQLFDEMDAAGEDGDADDADDADANADASDETADSEGDGNDTADEE